MENETPQRHGCLTAYLIFMLLANTLACLAYFFMGDKTLAQFPSAPTWTPCVLGIGGLINIAIALALFWWQKWAFYTFCVLAVVILLINVCLVGVNPVFALFGLLGPVVLYGVLQIGGAKKGWNYLK